MPFFEHNGYWMGGMHGLGWIFWTVLVVLVVLVFRARPPGSRPTRETPHQVLRRRLASGEISAAQYEEHKALLDRDTPAPH